MPETNNIPNYWQEIVANAIQLSFDRQAEQQMDAEEVLQEAYNQVKSQFRAAGASEEDVPAWMYAYLARAMHRILAYGLSYAQKNPPSHRKGYGTEEYTEITLPSDLIFRMNGVRDQDWPDGPGTEFPPPDEVDPNEDPDGPWWEPMMPNRVDVVRRVQAEFPEDWSAPWTRGADKTRAIRRIAWELYQIDENFGLNGKRGTTELSLDTIAYLNPTVDNDDRPGCEVADVIVNRESPNASATWSNITVPVSWGGFGARWIQPDPM